jgi:hypothetical protein
MITWLIIERDLSKRQALCGSKQHSRIEVFGVSGCFVDLAESFVSEESNDFVEAQARPRKGRTPQFIENLPFPNWRLRPRGESEAGHDKLLEEQLKLPTPITTKIQ